MRRRTSGIGIAVALTAWAWVALPTTAHATDYAAGSAAGGSGSTDSSAVAQTFTDCVGCGMTLAESLAAMRGKAAPGPEEFAWEAELTRIEAGTFGQMMPKETPKIDPYGWRSCWDCAVGLYNMLPPSQPWGYPVTTTPPQPLWMPGQDWYQHPTFPAWSAPW